MMTMLPLKKELFSFLFQSCLKFDAKCKNETILQLNFQIYRLFIELLFCNNEMFVCVRVCFVCLFMYVCECKTEFCNCSIKICFYIYNIRV